MLRAQTFAERVPLPNTGRGRVGCRKVLPTDSEQPYYGVHQQSQVITQECC